MSDDAKVTVSAFAVLIFLIGFVFFLYLDEQKRDERQFQKLLKLIELKQMEKSP